MIGCVPILLTSSENSNAPHKLKLSLIPMECILFSLQYLDKSWIEVFLRESTCKFFLAQTRLKRSQNFDYQKEENLSFGKITINKNKHQVLLDSNKIKLTKTEFSLLSLLVSKNKVFTRQELIDLVWGDNVIISDRSVDVHIRNIRIKIGKQHGDMIKTISGKGYGIIESYEPN